MQVRKLTIVLCLVLLMSHMQAGRLEIKGSSSEGQLAEETKEQEIPSEEETARMDENREPLIPIIKTEYIASETIHEKVLKRLGKESVKTVYSRKYQDAVTEIIEKYKKKRKDASDAPLFLYNPYGTMEQSMYFYYHSETACNVAYTISVDNEAIPDYERALNAGQDLEMEHEGVLIGVMPGMKNYITIAEMDDQGTILNSNVYCINLEKVEVSSQVLFSKDRNASIKKVSEGEFWLMESKKSKSPKIQMVDEYGIKRLVIPVEEAMNLDLIKVSEYLVYPKDSTKIVIMDKFGKADYIYPLGDYVYERGLRYNETTGCLYMIASDPARKSKADLVLAMNLGNGEVQVVMDFAGIDQEEKVSFNSLDFYGEDQLLVSCAEKTAVFCIGDIATEPKIMYVIAGDSHWNDSELAKMQYQAIGSFDPFTNQTSIQVSTEDKRLIDGQYYIIMLSSSDQGSSYYKIFVDENTKTYTLAEREDFGLEQICNSIQMIGQHLVVLMTPVLAEAEETDRMNQQVFSEFDENGDLAAAYYYEKKPGKMNQVKKMDLSEIW